MACLVVAACAAALATPASGAAPAPTGADAITLLSSTRIDPRLVELTLQTPAVDRPTSVRVLLPDGYDSHPGRSYPVLYLLHGGADDYRSWTDKGAAEAITAGADLIVVMPDSGPLQGYTDWYNGGQFGPPAWETYHVGQLIPWIDERFRTVAKRRGRAIAGLSMGGGGAIQYAARHPDLFVHAAGFSPAVDLTDPALIALNQLGPASPDGSNSPAYGPYATQEVRWRGENPVDLAENLRGLDVSLRTGNGQPGAGSGAGVDVIEAAVERMAVALHGRLDGLGIDHVFDDYGPGTHTWPFWQRDLRLELPLIERSFAKPPPRPRRFSFAAIEPAYSAYDWKVRIRRPALEFSRLLVEGKRRFALSGSGTAVVRTPARFEPREAYRVTLRGGPGERARTLRARRSGRLRIPIDLGAPNQFQQYTAEARAAGTAVYTTRVRIRGR